MSNIINLGLENGKKDDNSKHYSVVYIGDDQSYFSTLKTRFMRSLPHIAFDYHVFLVTDNESYRSCFLKIIEINPSIIYIDFSHKVAATLKISKLIRVENTFKKTPIIHLIETHENFLECHNIGATFIHIKSAEVYDVIYDAGVIAFPDQIKAPDFAKAKMDKIISLTSDFKIGYIGCEHIHVETDLILKVGTKVKVDTKLPENIVPSKYFIVKAKYTDSFYYHFNYAYDLEFVYVDKNEIRPLKKRLNGDETSEQIEKIQMEFQKEMENELNAREENIKKTKKLLKKWIEEQVYLSVPKNIKILMMDKTLEIYKGAFKSFDKYPFILRTQTYLTEAFHEIEKFRPNMIILRREDLPESIPNEMPDEMSEKIKDIQVEEAREEMREEKLEKQTEKLSYEEIRETNRDGYDFDRMLLQMIEKIKSLEDYHPFIILTNIEERSSLELQKEFEYQNLLVGDSVLNDETIIKFAQIYDERFQKKREKLHKEELEHKLKKLKELDPYKYRLTKIEELEPPKYYVKKTNPISNASITYEVKLLMLSESEITFESTHKLPNGTFRLHFLGPMAVTIMSNADTEDEKFIYQGLLHCTGEVTKKVLRRFVYEIFLLPVREKQQEEKIAYELLKKEKEEELRKKQQLEQNQTKKIS